VRASRLRVRLGHLAGLLAIALARPRGDLLLLGAALALLGEALRLWASGHIEKTRRLATGGPYAHTRNPLYLGSVVMALGFALAASSVWAAAVTLLYLLAFYPSVIHEEGVFLRGRFEGQYAAWERAVPLFLPRLTPGGPRGSRFSWQRVRVNREWRTALAIPLLVLVLYARGRWLPLL
jgi:protein-S-isoprenylcysteine O-methyltransferase Ste14